MYNYIVHVVIHCIVKEMESRLGCVGWGDGKEGGRGREREEVKVGWGGEVVVGERIGSFSLLNFPLFKSLCMPTLYASCAVYVHDVHDVYTCI